jgi:hypothetical protein
MKGIQLIITVAALALLTLSCRGDQQGGAADEEMEEADTTFVRPSQYVDNPSGVVYSVSRIENEVFYETGAPAHWDGRAVNDARPFLSMSIGEVCGRSDCGKQVYLTNSHESQSLRTIVTVPFQIGDSDEYLAREYIITPGEKAFIGCTHLCDGENAVDFKRAIVVAELE